MPETIRPGVAERVVRIEAGPVLLEGTLALPPEPAGVVLFAHGSGSSRHSPRNRYVARVLCEAHLATLLIDQIGPEETVTRRVQVYFPQPGKHVVEATLPEDPVETDNHRWCVIDFPAGEAVWALQGLLGPRDAGVKQILGEKFDKARFEQELVVGHAEYRTVANRAPHFRRCFAELFRTRSFLFLGSGLSEPYFVSLFDEIIELTGPPVRPAPVRFAHTQ